MPLSTYTEAYWKIDLHILLHFIDLRMDHHAQQEIRAYVRVIGEEVVARWVPQAWETFLDDRKRALCLSGVEADIVAALAAGEPARAVALASDSGLVSYDGNGRIKPNLERSEIDAKLEQLGWTPSWESAWGRQG